MEKHVTLVGIIRICMGALMLFAALLAVVAGVILFVEEPTPDEVAIVALAAALLVCLVMAALAIVTGIGLLRYRPWARYMAMVLSVFSLFNIPIGTAVAVYTYWVLLNDETIALFEGQPAV